ncbi:hypothetical protein [Fodinicola acaciae]|uniref:hypothetical protein n=1 Tax=Fodinicola acaciae TaxID=2681555 RepID=UPI0013D6E85E|nr:hypothetical protein [Fodinicola acaciae]
MISEADRSRPGGSTKSGSTRTYGKTGHDATSPFCRVTDLGGNPEEQKLLDVNCGNPGQGPLISTAALAEQIANRLPIPRPDLEIRPFTTYADGTRGGLTGAPMWLWIGKTWKPLTQHTALADIWVDVVATPTSSTWSFGDGGKLTCKGRGTPLTDPAQGLRGSPDCGHIYRTTSGKTAFTITATVTWTITWTGSGNTGGVLPPLYLTTSVPYTVKQARSQLVSQLRPPFPAYVQAEAASIRQVRIGVQPTGRVGSSRNAVALSDVTALRDVAR